jgi:hypothetical protein
VDLLLRNPGQPDLVVHEAYRFTATSDPQILGFTPTRGPRDGGTRVSIDGVHLDEIVRVRFGVDPVTGLGGARADAVHARSAGRVDATTTAQPTAGVFGLTVETADGRAALASGFTFEGTGNSNPGGTGFDLPAGGCAGSLAGRGADPRGAAGDVALAGAWAVLFLLLRRRTRRAPTGATAR